MPRSPPRQRLLLAQQLNRRREVRVARAAAERFGALATAALGRSLSHRGQGADR